MTNPLETPGAREGLTALWSLVTYFENCIGYNPAEFNDEMKRLVVNARAELDRAHPQGPKPAEGGDLTDNAGAQAEGYRDAMHRHVVRTMAKWWPYGLRAFTEAEAMALLETWDIGKREIKAGPSHPQHQEGLRWTREKPTREGWYFQRQIDSKTGSVRSRPSAFHSSAIAVWRRSRLDGVTDEWAGPIPEPQASQGAA